MNANADTNALPRKPIPLGVSSWTKLVGQNKLIVDKTAKLGKLVTLFDFVFSSCSFRVHGVWVKPPYARC